MVATLTLESSGALWKLQSAEILALTLRSDLLLNPIFQ